MSAAGMEALIIKVAGAGLSTKDLGKSITDPQMVDKLFKLVRILFLVGKTEKKNI